MDRKLSPVYSIGLARSGNGARRNWNCDHLLKEFTTTNMSRTNVANSHQGIILIFIVFNFKIFLKKLKFI